MYCSVPKEGFHGGGMVKNIQPIVQLTSLLTLSMSNLGPVPQLISPFSLPVYERETVKPL